jgi:uncharacterized protein (DUF1786 family)
MQVLTVDVGTGTQDIFVFRSGVAIENGFKLVMPSPTMIKRALIQEATSRREDLLLTGVTMGGGPCHWAARDHVKAGLAVYATPEAARTFNDDLEWVQSEMGVVVLSEDEARQLETAARVELRDFDYGAVMDALAQFGLRLRPAAVGVAVFDHGAAPPDVSDRQFRFDYLKDCIRNAPQLSSFAFRAPEVPGFLSRMRAVAKSAAGLDAPLVLMDTAPAAVLGATFDPRLSPERRRIIANIGNFHALAFRLGPQGIDGLFEHHTGLINRAKFESLLLALAEGTITNERVFQDEGHGAFVTREDPLPLSEGAEPIAVTGPRRDMMAYSPLSAYNAVPFGDMMLSGCFGLLSAVADQVPETAPAIRSAMAGEYSSVAPWDADER